MMQSLLQTIAASPHDYTAQFIYADWLEEHGVAWATLWREGLRRTPVIQRLPGSRNTGRGDGSFPGQLLGNGQGDGGSHSYKSNDRGDGMGVSRYFLTEGLLGDGSGRGIMGQPGGNGGGNGLHGDHRGDGGSQPADRWV